MFEEGVKRLVLESFDLVGIASVVTPPSIVHYENWIRNQEHGKMKYLEAHQERKKNPELLLPGAKSWIVAAHYYDTTEPLSIDIMNQLKQKNHGWISRYARGGDYHNYIGSKLDLILNKLKTQFPEEKFLGCVDIKAVLERDTAQRAGIGWIGKNTCVINQEIGSFIFLAEILTTLKLSPDKQSLDHCGTCSRCIDICPTGAIVEDHHVDARKCISYWTIENDSLPPKELSQNFKQNLFGCDLCQDVCPWNQKARRGGKPQQADDRLTSSFDLRELMQLSVEDLESKIKGTAMERAGAKHLQQTAQILLSE